MGGRTSMMGGAAVATGEDEATPFVNPAGITRVPGQSFSFSTVTIQLAARKIEGALDPTDKLDLADPNVAQVKLRILPQTFCVFLDGPPKHESSPHSRHKYALCAATAEREELSFTQNQSNLLNVGAPSKGTGEASNLKFVRSTLAFSWGFELDPETSLGVTARVDNARLNDQNSATAYSFDGGAGRMQTLQLSQDAWSWDTSVVVGLTSHVSRVVTLGASLTTPSQHLLGSYKALSSSSSTVVGEQSLTQDLGDFRYNHPGSLRLGLAFSWPRFVLEADGSFYGPQRQLARANFDRVVTTVRDDGGGPTAPADSVRGSVTERGAPVSNLSLGAEYFLQPDFSLLAGLQTDFSGIHPRVTSAPTNILFRQQRDAYYASIGVSSYGALGRLLIGIRGSYTSGSVLVAAPAEPQPTFVALRQTGWGLGLVVSGEISLHSISHTAFRAAAPLTQLPISHEAPSEPGERQKRETK